MSVSVSAARRSAAYRCTSDEARSPATRSASASPRTVSASACVVSGAASKPSAAAASYVKSTWYVRSVSPGWSSGSGWGLCARNAISVPCFRHEAYRSRAS